MTASRSDTGKRSYFFTRIFTNFLNLHFMIKIDFVYFSNGEVKNYQAIKLEQFKELIFLN